ncbi:MAG TPA: HNH endonuclease [bacterium]|nr:HNH endonuclease [bacterium]
MTALIDLSGRTFGTLAVVKRVPTRSSDGRAYWRVRCSSCGREYEVRSDNLRRGAVTCRCQGPTCLKPRKVAPGEFGARYINGDGYVRLYAPWHPSANAQGWLLEHRYVMEQIIGRPLRPEEVVHHNDRDRVNNAPENLTLYENEAAHAAFHAQTDDGEAAF